MVLPRYRQLSHDLIRVDNRLAFHTAASSEANENRPGAETVFIDTPHRERARRFQVERGGETHDAGSVRTNREPLRSIREPASNRQLKFLVAIARERGFSVDDLEQQSIQMFGKTGLSDLDRRQASAMINEIQEYDVVAQAS